VLVSAISPYKVTRAAARVGIGQSAMSHNLARLRELFGDELLTRGSDGMRLTPRAVTLLEPVRTMLAQVEALVSRDQAFDPATAVRTFRFGLSDSMEVLIMPALLARMREVAPGIHLRLTDFDASRLLDELDADEMDIAIGYDLMLQGQFHHKRRKLFTETWLCMFNAEMTDLAPPISLDDYLRLPHVVTSLRPGRSARGIVDGALDKLGLRRSIALTTPRFLTVPSLVARAPVLVTMQRAHGPMPVKGARVSLRHEVDDVVLISE